MSYAQKVREGMNEPILGILSDGEPLAIDLARLVETRLLITATSGAGKSWAIRRILEQTHGRGVQHLVIDPEGEFHTLREKFDYVLFGRNGDYPLSVDTARELAKRLRELRISAVMDVSEMKPEERIDFVREFVEALMETRQQQWHPTLLVVDEAQFFAPESGSADSLAAMRDLSMRGRKRGLCPIFATQRPAALSKDCAASCGNKLVGRTVLDNDVRRAGDDLGFDKRQSAQLRELLDGSFFAVGPALSRTVTLVTVGPVETTHPKVGQHSVAAPPPKATVQKALAALADMQTAAVEERSELERLRAENERLKNRPAAGVDPAEVEAARKAGFIEGQRELRPLIERMKKNLTQIVEIAGSEIPPDIEYRDFEEVWEETVNPEKKSVVRENRTTETAPPIREENRKQESQVAGNKEVGTGGLRRILIALAQRPNGLTNRQIGVRAGLSSGSGTFSTYLSKARTNGWIEGNGVVRLTAAGKKALGSYQPLPTGRKLLEHWLGELGSGGASRMLEALYQAHPNPLSNQELGELACISASSGTFSTYLSKLRTLELITGERGQIRISEELI